MPPAPPVSRRIVPDTRMRDTLIAVGVGVLLLGGLGYTLFFFSEQADSTGQAEGIIVSKEFVPQPETRITVGCDGLSTRQIEGEYSFQVRVPREHDKVYKVIVGKADYETRREGEAFRFFER